MHCKKQQLFFTCILYFAPLFLLLCWTSPSRNSLRSVICWIGPARLGFFVLYYIQSSRAVGLHLTEEWATMVPSIICTWDGLNSHLVGACRWSEPVVTDHCCNSSETFVIRSTFSVFNIKFLRSVFLNIQERVHLNCQVLWFGVFFIHLTWIWHSYRCYLYKTFLARNFPHLFVIRRRKIYNNTTFFAFLWLSFFQCCGIFFKFWILPSLLCHSQFKGFFQYM